MVLDELMFRGPAKAVKKKVNNHPSNGFDQLLNFVKKTWPTHFLVARSDYNVRLLSQTKTVCLTFLVGNLRSHVFKCYREVRQTKISIWL